MLKTYHVLVSGSARLSSHFVEFVEILGEKFIENKDLILFTGGLKSIEEGTPMVDYSVVKGALRKLKISNDDLAQRIISLLPEHEYEKAIRFNVGNIITIKHTNVRSRR